MNTVMLPRDAVEDLLRINDELIAIVTDNILKRVPKRQGTDIIKRTRAARSALLLAMKEGSQ